MANLKFAAEICLRVRIPPPAPASPSRPVPLIEERGDFFRTRFAGSMASRRHQIMRCGSPLSAPSSLSNRDIPSYQSPRLPYRFSRAAASENPIRFAVPRPYSAWRDATPPSFSPRSLHDWRQGSASAPLPAFLSVQSASRLPPRLAFRQTARCLRSFVQMSVDDTCFSRAYPFSPSISPRHVIH